MKEYDWLQPTLERLSDLLRMPDVHNSYGTPKVDPGCVWMVLRMMSEGRMQILPVPEISPNKSGGLNFVWHGVETVCALSIFPKAAAAGLFTVDVSSRKGALIRDFGEFSHSEQQLRETLEQISMELSPEVPAP